MCILLVIGLVLVTVFHLVMSVIEAVMTVVMARAIKRELERTAPEALGRLPLQGLDSPLGFTRENLEWLQDPETNLSEDMQAEVQKYLAMVYRCQWHLKSFVGLILGMFFVPIALIWLIQANPIGVLAILLIVAPYYLFKWTVQ